MKPPSWLNKCLAAALLLAPAIARAADNPATGMSGGMSQGMSGGSCCPESGLLKGTMGTVAMGLGAVLLISLIVTLWALTIFLIRRSRVRPPPPGG